MDHDLIVVGGGAAGLGAIRAALWSGADVAMITDSAPGGECTFSGCVPSKTLLAAARDGLNFSAAMTRVREAISHFAATESVAVLRAAGATVIEGRGRLVTHDTVAVADQRITAARIVIATGAKPAMPEIKGLQDIKPLTNETVFDLTEAPRSLGIIGGGATGCELAQAFAALGVSVTLFEADSRLLPDEEPEAGALVQAALERLRVRVILDASIDYIEQAARPDLSSASVSDERADSDRPASSIGTGHDVDPARSGAGRCAGPPAAAVHHKAAVGASIARTVVDRLLVAAGRTPSISGMGLQELGIRLTTAGQIITDDKLETSVRGVFAAGDVACWPSQPQNSSRSPPSSSKSSAGVDGRAASLASRTSADEGDASPASKRWADAKSDTVSRSPRWSPARGSRLVVRARTASSPMLAHAADEMGRLAVGNALGKGLRGRFRGDMVPRAVFTDPEVASVGVTPRHAPRGSRVAYLPLAEVDRAIIEDRTDGFIAIVAGPRRLLRHAAAGRVLGAAIVAPHATEMIQEIVFAMRANSFTGRLAQASHAYPTWSSGIQKAAAQFFGEIEGRQARTIT